MPTRSSIALVLLAAGSVACHAAPQESAEGDTRFPIQQFRVGGNTLVGSEALQLRLANFLGEARSMEDLMAARQAVIAAYQEAGRPLVAVGLPEEFGTDGVVRLQVVEIPVREIHIEGNERLSSERIRARLPSLVEAQSPAMDEINRQLALANDNPALKLSLEFVARQDMAADVRVQVEERPPVSVALTTDNTGTSETGHWRVGVSVTDADLSGRGDIASLTYITSPQDPDKVHQFSGSYLWPIASLGDAVIFSGSYSDVDAGRIGEDFSVAGQGDSVGVRYQRTIVRTVTRRATLDIGIDHRRYRNIIDFSGADLGSDVASRPLTVSYAYSDLQPSFQWGGSLSYVANVTGGTDNDNRAYRDGRSGASAAWSLWRGNGRAAARLPLGLVAQVTGEAQYTEDPLISGEQFGVGGARSVRGFDERAVAGDRGWHVGGEISTPVLGAWGRFAMFADRGGETRLSALPGESSAEIIASWGIGWRYTRSGFAAVLDWAQVLDGTSDVGRGQQKIHVQASLQF